MVIMSNTIDKCLDPVPRVDIGFFPTPLQRLHNLSEKYDIDLYIKRDDLSGPGFGGNKVRKLEYIIAEALEENCDYIVTYGGFQSNHCRQLTASCRKYGLEPVLYLIGDEEPKESRANLHLDRLMDAEIHHITDDLGDVGKTLEPAMELAQQRIDELKKEGHRVYNCPSGGFNPTGTLGFIRAFGELDSQFKKMKITPDYLVHATGTGGTYTGLMMGKKIIGSDVGILPFSVAPLFPGLKGKISETSKEVSKKLNIDGAIISPDEIDIDTDHYGPGYDIPYQGSINAVKELAREEGIILGPAYTAKAMAGLLDNIKKGKIQEGSTVIFWHTGGTPTIFAESSIVGDVYG